MEKSLLGLHSLIELQFLIEPELATHYHENFELLYLMNGNLTVTVEEETFRMQPQDLILINSNRKHSYRGSEEVFIGRFVISYSKVQELLE